MHDKVFQLVLIILKFFILYVIIPFCLETALMEDSLIAFFVSIGIIKACSYILSKLYNELAPWFKKYCKNNKVILNIILIETFLKELSVTSILEHGRKKCVELIYKLLFLLSIATMFVTYIKFILLKQIKDLYYCIYGQQFPQTK